MATQNIFGAPDFSWEPFLYNAFAVGPAEELFFRGPICALVLEAFGARKTILKAEMNWGMIPAALCWHGCARPQAACCCPTWSMSTATISTTCFKQAQQSRLHQPALHFCRFDEAFEQGVRREGARLVFRVELHADEPGMVRVFDDFRQDTVRRQP